MSNNIYQKISSIMDEIGAIGKNNRNNAQNFMFRGIDDVYNALHPLLTKYKVFTVPEIMESSVTEKPSKSGGTLFYTRLKMKYTFYTDDGSSFQSVVMGEAMDSGDKGANKAMSIAHKYCLLQVFAIPTEETSKDDPDNESHDIGTNPQSPKQKPAAAKPVSIKPTPQVLSPNIATPTIRPNVKVDPDLAKLDKPIHSSITQYDAGLEGLTWRQAANGDPMYMMEKCDKLIAGQKKKAQTRHTGDNIEFYNLVKEYAIEVASKRESLQEDKIPF